MTVATHKLARLVTKESITSALRAPFTRYQGVSGPAELAEDAAMGTTGQLHHHLRALVAAGWLQSTGRAHWAVVPQRVIPLLVVISASTN